MKPILMLLALTTSATCALSVGCASFDTQSLPSVRVDAQGKELKAKPAGDNSMAGDSGETATPAAGSDQSEEGQNPNQPESKPEESPPGQATGEEKRDPDNGKGVDGSTPTAPPQKIEALPPIKVEAAKPEAAAPRVAEVTFASVSFLPPAEWQATASDFGAFATLRFMGDGLGRSIDLYREGQFVTDDQQGAWISASARALTGHTEQGFKVEREDAFLTVRREGTKRIQVYASRFTPVGVMSGVLTTRQEHLDADRKRLVTLLDSLQPKAASEFHASAEKALGMTFSIEDEWLSEVRDGALLMRPTWIEGGTGMIQVRWKNSTIEDQGGKLAFFAQSRSDLEDAYGGLWKLSEAKFQNFGPWDGVRIDGDKGGSTKSWIFVITDSRIITIIADNLADPKSASKLAASLKELPSK